MVGYEITQQQDSPTVVLAAGPPQEIKVAADEMRVEPSRAPFRILSIDGGGYLGLATAAFIESCERHFERAFTDTFHLFCGTSTGAIIALGLANGLSGADIVQLYRDLGPAVFSTPRCNWFRAKHSNAPLRDALQRQLGETTLAELLARGKHALVTAFNVTQGSPRIFKTDHSQNLSRDGDLPLWQVMLASTAAPTYFPLVSLTNPREGITEVFCDGGVAANHPALLGLGEALSELAIPASRLRVLSLSTPRLSLTEGGSPPPHLDRGIWGWRTTLPRIFVDASSDLTHQTLLRLTRSFPEPRPVYERVALENRYGLAIDDASERAIKILMQTGATAAASTDNRVKVGRIMNDGRESNG